MSKQLKERIGTQEYENLFAGTTPPADVFSVKVRAGQGTLIRGTALALVSGGDKSGEMVVLGTAAGTSETLTANCVLAESVDTGDSAGSAVHGLGYRTGHFIGNRLTVKDSYTITQNDKEALRKGGILLSDAL